MLIFGYIFKASGDFEFGEDFYGLQQIFVCGKYKDEIDYMINVPRSLRRNCESLHEFKYSM
jgi:hypothetical protein